MATMNLTAENFERTVSGNDTGGLSSTNQYGGGILNTGRAELTACTVSGNRAQNCGDINNIAGGSLRLLQSTVSGNAATSGVIATP